MPKYRLQRKLAEVSTSDWQHWLQRWFPDMQNVLSWNILDLRLVTYWQFMIPLFKLKCFIDNSTMFRGFSAPLANWFRGKIWLTWGKIPPRHELAEHPNGYKRSCTVIPMVWISMNGTIWYHSHTVSFQMWLIILNKSTYHINSYHIEVS